MMNYDQTFGDIIAFMAEEKKLSAWVPSLEALLREKLYEKPHGDMQRWLDAVNELPDITSQQVNLESSRVGASGETTQHQREQLEAALTKLIPWRKGPYELFDVHIDTEWRSDWKWDRVAPHVSDLNNRSILDVGCGSGYHCWRMLGAGARQVIGIDPSYLFLMQFSAIKQYCGAKQPIHLLPIRMEDVHPQLEYFDTVFSMGILYHRKSPIDHLFELKGALRPGGELVLETLVIEGALGQSLVPEDRYAMMRNVWFLPTVETLELWLRRAGFKDIKCVDLNVTSCEEQRATDWMRFNSLEDFLNPEDRTLTVEGYPAPLRATLIAKKPR